MKQWKLFKELYSEKEIDSIEIGDMFYYDYPTKQSIFQSIKTYVTGIEKSDDNKQVVFSCSDGFQYYKAQRSKRFYKGLCFYLKMKLR